jgi:hypothetical protein
MTSRQNDTKSYMRRRYYDRHIGLRESNDIVITNDALDESYRPSCGSRLFERVMLRENIAKITKEFFNTLRGKCKLYINDPHEAEKLLYSIAYRQLPEHYVTFDYREDAAYGNVYAKAYDEVEPTLRAHPTDELDYDQDLQAQKLKDAKTLVMSISGILSKNWGGTKLEKWFDSTASVERIAANLAGLPGNFSDLIGGNTEISVPKNKILYHKRKLAM